MFIFFPLSTRRYSRGRNWGFWLALHKAGTKSQKAQSRLVSREKIQSSKEDENNKSQKTSRSKKEKVLSWKLKVHRDTNLDTKRSLQFDLITSQSTLITVGYSAEKDGERGRRRRRSNSTQLVSLSNQPNNEKTCLFQITSAFPLPPFVFSFKTTHLISSSTMFPIQYTTASQSMSSNIRLISYFKLISFSFFSEKWLSQKCALLLNVFSRTFFFFFICLDSFNHLFSIISGLFALNTPIFLGPNVRGYTRYIWF